MSDKTKKKRRAVEKMTLRKALRVFFTSHPSPGILVVGLLISWALRISMGGFTFWDLGIVVAILAAWPLVEWTIHVFILHFKPFQFAGLTIDPHLAKKHRDHHSEPGHMPDVFIPLRSLLMTLPAAVFLWWLITPTTELMLTGIAVLFAMGTIYEWCHFLIHTNYRAKTSVFKRLWQHHRLHHFKHEENWFGVSMTLGDRMLGTAPDFREIETSDTCRTLGVKRESIRDAGESI